MPMPAEEIQQAEKLRELWTTAQAAVGRSEELSNAFGVLCRDNAKLWANNGLSKSGAYGAKNEALTSLIDTCDALHREIRARPTVVLTRPRQIGAVAIAVGLLVALVFFATLPALDRTEGGLALDRYCTKRGATVTVNVSDARSWKCVNPGGKEEAVDIDDACKEQNNMWSRARMADSSNAYSWSCRPPRWRVWLGLA